MNKKRQLIAYRIIQPASLFIVYSEFLKVRMELYSVKTERNKPVDFFFLVFHIRVERAESYQLIGVLFYRLHDKIIDSLYLVRRSGNRLYNILRNTALIALLYKHICRTVKVHIQIVEAADIVCRFLCNFIGKNMSVCVYYIFTVT